MGDLEIFIKDLYYLTKVSEIWNVFLSHFGGSENYLSFNFWMICGFVFSAVSDCPHVRS